MADVSKIKLPNNSEVNIKDYRIPGVDNTPTSGSDNVVTSDGIYNALREDTPLYTKTYTYKCAAATEAEAYIYFMNITPTSSEWATPWTVHYTLTVDCDTSEDANAKYCHGDYDVFIGCAGSNYYYHIFNKFYSGSYYPIYYHKLIYHNTEAKYNSYRESHPAKAGVRVLSAWNSNTRTRTYTIKVYDYKNCTISFPDNIENHTTAYNNTYNNVVDFNATSTGLQETGDANTANYYNYEYYVGYRIHSSETPLYRYKFVGFDNRNRIVPINITNQTNATIINKTACSVPMTVSNGLALYNTTTIIDNDTTVIATGTLYRDTSIVSGILQYNLSESVGRTSNSTVSQEVYLVGTYDIKTDEFTLDDSSYTSFYKVVPILQSESDYFASFTIGKYYWYLGQCPVNDNVFNFTPPHPVFYFNGTKLIEVHSQEFKNISDQLFVYAQSLNDLNTNKENLSNKVTSISNASTNTEYPSAAAVVGYVTNCVDTALASALQYKGTVASNSNLPATHKVGWVYVVSTAGTFAGKSCEVGDYIICKTAGTSANNAHWDVINGENQVENKSASLAAAGSSATIATVDGTDITVTTPSTWTGLAKTGTVTSVTINATSPIAIDSSAAITTSGTRTISHANSGVTAGTYKSVTVNATGHVTGGTNPTTLAGYGITDAALASNTVTSIGTSGNYLTWTKNGNTNNITIPFATSSTTAAKLGTDTIGNIHRPIYIKNGIGTEVTDVAMDYIGWPKENHTNLSSLDNLYYFSAPNVLSYPKPDYIDIEYTNDGGTSWITHPSATNANKIALFTTSYGFSLGNKTSSAGITVNDGLRITLHLGAGMYCSMKFLAIRHFFPGECDVTIEYTTYANPTTYVEHTTLTKISSNPGYRIIPFDKFLFGNNGVHDLRITAFYTGTTYINNSYTISEIRGFANNVYTYTSQLANTGHLYSYDSDKNATFPANITAAKFVKSGGTSSQFLKADGSVDSNTYSTTDTKVTQTKTGSSNTSWRPLLLGYSYSDSNPFNPATVTNTTYAAHLGAFAPTTGLLKLVGLKRINTSGSDVTGSNTDVWNTNGSITSLSSYYQKPSGGIPASDLASGVIPTVEALTTSEIDTIWNTAMA